MSERDYPANEGQREPADDDGAESKEGASADEAADESPLDEAESLRQEAATLNDRVLRLAAEIENVRRRAEREKADAGRYAIAQFARDLLSVADNFERALQSALEERESHSAENISSLISGLKMTEKELLTIFERHGVRRLYPKGEKFDPHLHQAVAQVPGGAPAGHVVDVAQPGFTIGDRVLRAAMVTVSTGDGENSDNDAGEPGAQVDTQA
ncbi:MAG: nucleotide exchange factor GrpE [Parvularculaceae bacterium]